jgi:membrane protein YdbS with pleckstrin-like domain
MLSGDAALSMKPVFIAWNALAGRLWMLFYFAAIFGAAGTILTSIIFRTDTGVPAFVAFSAVGLMIAPFPVYAATRLNYARTEYRIFPDRLEYEQGFFVVRKKVIMFRDVLEVTLQQSVTQRMYGLGTINLSTQASDVDDPSPQAASFGLTPGVTSGASIQDIAKPEEAFGIIQKLVDGCKPIRSPLPRKTRGDASSIAS